MPKVFYGTKDDPPFELTQSNDLIAVRTRSKRSVTTGTGPVPSPLAAEVDDGELVAAYPDAGVEVFRVPVKTSKRSLEERKSALMASADVRFAGGVLVDPNTAEPVLYTENLFVKFVDSADPEDCLEVLREAGLTVKYPVEYANKRLLCPSSRRFGTGRMSFRAVGGHKTTAGLIRVIQFTMKSRNCRPARDSRSIMPRRTVAEVRVALFCLLPVTATKSVDNDGYAANPKVIAVAACNDRSARSVYSDFGNAVWCSFPSSDFGHSPFNHPEPLTTGIWCTIALAEQQKT